MFWIQVNCDEVNMDEMKIVEMWMVSQKEGAWNESGRGWLWKTQILCNSVI